MGQQFVKSPVPLPSVFTFTKGSRVAMRGDGQIAWWSRTLFCDVFIIALHKRQPGAVID